jgi:hypothetical protein
MIKEILKIANNNVDFLNLQDNHLSIQLSLDGFSFCINNQISGKFGYIAVYKFPLQSISPYKHLEYVEEVFKQDELLQLKYSKVTVYHFNKLITQVPAPLFNKNKLADYLKYSIKVLENDFIAYDKIENSDIINVYIPFVNINNFLLDKYGGFIYKHASTPLIEKLLQTYKNLEGANYFVNVTNGTFELVVLKNKNLEFYNCFSFTTKEDFIYYILFTVEQLSSNPEELQLTLLGDIEKESELYTILYQYIRNITFYSPVNSRSEFEGISPHSYFTFLN